MSPEERGLLQQTLDVADAVIGGLSEGLEAGEITPAGLVAGLTVALQRALRAATEAGHDLSAVNAAVERAIGAVDAAAVTKGTVQ